MASPATLERARPIPAATTRTDVHQHLWPPELIEALRRRRTVPYLVDWTLYLDGEPPFQIDPVHHDTTERADREHSDDLLLSLSSPLGIEGLRPAEGQPLLDAWHQGATEFGFPFRSWASVNHLDPHLDGLREHLAAGFVGLQVPATQLASPAALERLLPTLRVVEAANKPVLVHPGPVSDAPDGVPGWWPAVVSYPSQLQAAWWTWYTAGRRSLPQLRICFAAGAGLAPLHHERFTARGGGPFIVDPSTFVDTSSYGPRGIDSLIRVLGVDALVFGSDRPYAAPGVPSALGAAVERALHISNPHRFLEGSPS